MSRQVTTRFMSILQAANNNNASAQLQCFGLREFYINWLVILNSLTKMIWFSWCCIKVYLYRTRTQLGGVREGMV